MRPLRVGPQGLLWPNPESKQRSRLHMPCCASSIISPELRPLAEILTYRMAKKQTSRDAGWKKRLQISRDAEGEELWSQFTRLASLLRGADPGLIAPITRDRDSKRHTILAPVLSELPESQIEVETTQPKTVMQLPVAAFLLKAEECFPSALRRDRQEACGQALRTSFGPAWATSLAGEAVWGMMEQARLHRRWYNKAD